MKQLLITIFIPAFIFLLGCTKKTDETTQPSSEKTRTYKIDPEADKLLQQMSDNLSSAEEFTVRVESSTDYTNDTGEKLKLHQTVDVYLKRPNKIMVEIHGDNGHKKLIYNGSEAVLYHINHGMYSIVKAPGTVDETLDFLADDYDLQIPASDFAYSDPYSYMMEVVKGIRNYGVSLINGVYSHHLYVTQEEIDWQIWIEDNDQNTPRKFLINFKKDEGSPQFTAYLSDWNFSPSLSSDIFNFTPPEGTKEIEFLKVDKNSGE